MNGATSATRPGGVRLRPVVFLVVGVLLVLLAAPLFGAVSLPFGALVAGGLDETAHRILVDIRIPRVVVGFITGGALALGGLVAQTVFRNVLATPYTLGVSSGASLGVAAYFKFGLLFAFAGIPGSAWAALVGAVGTVLFIDRVAARGAGTTTLLLAGVVISFFAASLISFLEYLSGATALVQLSRWLMGGLESVSLSAVVAVAPLIGVGVGMVFFHAGDLDLLALGDELALSRGVAVRSVRRRLLLGTSLMVGAVVSFAGPIGFVGLMVPHSLRLLLGNGARILVPTTVVAGGAFLVVCDTVARTIAAPFEIPVGVMTALLGGPYFLWLLLRAERPRR